MFELVIPLSENFANKAIPLLLDFNESHYNLIKYNFSDCTALQTMRNNNKSPKSGKDRAFGKEKFGEKGRATGRNSENESRSFQKDYREKPAKSFGKPDFTKSGKGFEGNTNDNRGGKTQGGRFSGVGKSEEYRTPRPAGDRDEKRPYERGGNSDRRSGGFGNSEKRGPYRPAGDRDEKRPYERSGNSDRRSGGFGNSEKRGPYRPAGDRDEKRPYERGGNSDRRSEGFGNSEKRGPYRPAGDRDEKRPYERGGNSDRRSEGFGNSEKRGPYRPAGDRDEKSAYQSGNSGEGRSGAYGKSSEQRPFNRDNKSGGYSAGRGEKRTFSGKGSFKSDFENDEQDFRPAYEPKFKKKDYGDKNKRDFFERKNKWEEKAGREGNTFDKKKPEGKFSKPVVNNRQHNPGGKTGSPRYKFDTDGAKPAKGVQPIKTAKKEESNTIRLNRYISNSGICSRREADDLILSGQITVNGKPMTEMGYQVKNGDTVKYGKKILNPEKVIYVLMNKPKDYITTMDDPENRKTVMDLLEGAFPERVYPVGRLDRNTTGLLLLTNDGEMADKLTHPSYNTRKIYQAELDKPFTVEAFEKLKEGVELEDGFIKPDDLAIITPDAYVIGIEIHSGKNRVVRRIFESLGYDVKKLDRTVFANLNKKDLPRGKWRYLTEKEVIGLKFLS